MKNYEYTQDLNTNGIEKNLPFNVNYHSQIDNQTIRTQRDYHQSIALITTLQELIEVEEAKISDYFRRKKV